MRGYPPGRCTMRPCCSLGFALRRPCHAGESVNVNSLGARVGTIAAKPTKPRAPHCSPINKAWVSQSCGGSRHPHGARPHLIKRARTTTATRCDDCEDQSPHKKGARLCPPSRSDHVKSEAARRRALDAGQTQLSAPQPAAKRVTDILTSGHSTFPRRLGSFGVASFCFGFSSFCSATFVSF
jgi:hypothetical protein